MVGLPCPGLATYVVFFRAAEDRAIFKPHAQWNLIQQCIQWTFNVMYASWLCWLLRLINTLTYLLIYYSKCAKIDNGWYGALQLSKDLWFSMFMNGNRPNVHQPATLCWFVCKFFVFDLSHQELSDSFGHFGSIHTIHDCKLHLPNCKISAR